MNQNKRFQVSKISNFNKYQHIEKKKSVSLEYKLLYKKPLKVLSLNVKYLLNDSKIIMFTTFFFFT